MDLTHSPKHLSFSLYMLQLLFKSCRLYALPRNFLSWLMLLNALSLAVPARASYGEEKTPGVGSVLNPNGTLRADARGAFDATGYALATDPGDRPVFRAVAGLLEDEATAKHPAKVLQVLELLNKQL